MSPSPVVTLRARAESDLDMLFAIASELDTWEERSPSSPAPLTREAFDARLARTASESGGRNAQFVVDVNGEGVGTVSLFGFDELAHHAEVGIALIAEARGKGVGTAAVSQLMEFAFVRCNLHRVHLEVIASNLGAIRSYEKAGFVVEGRQREHAWVRGHYEDNVVMGILRSEWLSRRQESGGSGRS